MQCSVRCKSRPEVLEDGGTILGVTFDSGVSFGEYRVSVDYALIVADDTTQSATGL